MTYAMEELSVLDISQGVPGPLCAMQLGDLGARVTKVEPPDGDWLRRVGPYVGGESSLFLQVNRNKRGVAIDAKTAEGRTILQQLSEGVDVIVDGYRPGVAERLGLGYDEVRRRNPRAIYLSITAFGTDGPMAHEAGSEIALQSMVGTNRQVGVADEEPLRLGFDMASVSAAWAGVQGVMAALFARERTGRGQRVETSMLASLMAIWQWNVAAESKPDAWRGVQLTGYTDPQDHGYQTADLGMLVAFRGDEDGWRQFCRTIGADEVLEDPRFTLENRRNYDGDLKSIISRHLATKSYEEVRRLVRELDGTVVPMHDMKSLFDDPQVAAIAAIGEFTHPVAGEVKALNPPWHFSEPLVRSEFDPPPLLGQHTDTVLEELGYRADDIGGLRARRIIR